MTQPLSFVILSTGLDSFKEIRSALASDSRARLLAGGNDAEQLSDEIVRLKPDAAIITLGAAHEQALALMERLAAECPQTAIIAGARDASPDLILRAMRAGAREFLRLPINSDELETVLDRVAEFCAGNAPIPRKKGRMIAVFSSKGGCGTSFVAANLACVMRDSTCLVDLNLQAGDLPLFLGVEPKYSIADMVENRARMDDSLVASYITPYSDGVSLLAAPREADSADEIEPEHVFEILERLRENYSYVVLDPQHTFDAITLAALDQSDDIVLTLTLDIPAIRSAQRALEIFDRLGYPRSKVSVIVNRWSKQIDLDLHQVEKFLGEPVVGFVPSDYQVAVSSINLGQPLVESNPASRIATEIRRIAAAVTGEPAHAEEPQAERRNFWSALFRRERARKQAAPALNVRESLHTSISR
ncbi:MAG TPA: AAA family ATPase [Pyrinomonadaceae bacterium]|jgi:pilus assembly protein CpaE